MASPLALSDRSWGTRGRGSPGSGRIDRTSFLRLVEETDPDIVVFAGDAAYDRCSRSGLDETELFFGLLREITAAGRHSVVVEGNNDDTLGTYGRVREAAEASPFLHEISGKAETVRGIRFLGVPTGKEKRMAESARSAADIVVAHAPLANRVWLFDLPAPCIVTGHYAMLADVIAGKAYLALDCLPASYAVIEQGRIEYVAGACRIVMRPGEEIAATGCDPALLRDLMEGGTAPLPRGGRGVAAGKARDCDRKAEGGHFAPVRDGDQEDAHRAVSREGGVPGHKKYY